MAKLPDVQCSNIETRCNGCPARGLAGPTTAVLGELATQAKYWEGIREPVYGNILAGVARELLTDAGYGMTATNPEVVSSLAQAATRIASGDCVATPAQ